MSASQSKSSDYALANLAIGGINLTANFIFGIWLNSSF
ncbi:hypothetical protein CAMRE0001_0932 [Campylobacter rectus RM3267]|uniref:Uncharacterized protein n=1 Tax=Campylobacter rectus RM3267 TaxID=553218 RepID=B9D2J8_CAMRE|nr:hypothetical protein CAMRE0001_0932 [Campylobacter rectus RM3267]